MNEFDIDNINFMCYDFLYNKSYDNYDIGSIAPSTLNINNIKYIITSSNFLEYENMMKNIFKSEKIEFKNHDNEKKIITMIRYGDYPVDININYNSIKNIDNIKIYDKNNINETISYILNDIIIDKKIDGLLLNVINFIIDPVILKSYNLDKLDKYDSLILNKNYISINITENYFNNMITFDQYLDEQIKNNSLDINIIKKILFKILYNLNIIQDKYPNFRHNNLLLNNIKIQFLNDNILNDNNNNENIYNTKFQNYVLQNDKI